jgi:hypothetical protein
MGLQSGLHIPKGIIAGVKAGGRIITSGEIDDTEGVIEAGIDLTTRVVQTTA